MPLPAYMNPNRRTNRAPVNPLDKSTIVSIYPHRIHESKPTIEPGEFIIEPGRYEKPSTLVVGPSSWWREIDPDQPLLEIAVSSIAIARSVVRDYCSGLLACNMADTMPGLFMLPGEHTIANIQKNNKDLLDAANLKQRNWYTVLVKLADSLWARSGQNPLCISDDMRLAAQELGMKDKSWLQDFATIQKQNCPACGMLRNHEFPVCPNCKTIIDAKRFQELGLKMSA